MAYILLKLPFNGWVWLALIILNFVFDNPHGTKQLTYEGFSMFSCIHNILRHMKILAANTKKIDLWPGVTWKHSEKEDLDSNPVTASVVMLKTAIRCVETMTTTIARYDWSFPRFYPIRMA
ncbi:hypothetical protein CEXT_578301 [Caerostris extrusa]|uniref:Uncharacterized protein n=1 Tax=Caerostris extrusa TaxID=172846 RepID=A0AAV4VY90_CAEEX|nr:hypothetical protein CEXT_578301 [Caerostris extrusa]